MGIRVAPDGYDIVVWKFDEASSPFENSSTTGFYTALNSRLHTGTRISVGYNNATLPQSTIGVISTTGFPSSGTIYIIIRTLIAAGSNGAILPQSTINVGSTSGFLSSGTIFVETSSGTQTVTYTGKTATSFTGCAGGAGTMSTVHNVTSDVPQTVTYTGITSTTFTGCSGGLGQMNLNYSLVYNTGVPSDPNIVLQQPSPFAATGTNSAVLLRSTGAVGMLFMGANMVEPQPPVTFSGWYLIRTHSHNLGPNGGCYFIKMNTDQTPQLMWLSGVQIGDVLASRITLEPVVGTGNVTIPKTLNITANAWSHVGITYDNTTTKVYINGNLVGSTTNGSGPTNIKYTGFAGPWTFVARPSNTEVPAGSICDFRIANVVRPQSYFQNIYRLGATTSGYGQPFQTYYKLRAYDLSCSTPTAVYWTSTTIDYVLAPAAPCGSLGPIEIMETWSVLG